MGNIRTYSPYGEPYGSPPLGRGGGGSVIWPILVAPHNPPKGGRWAESGMFVYPPSLGEHRGETITVGLINIYQLAHHAIAQEKSLPGEPYMTVGHLYQALSGQSS